ncbi:MAG TPA: DUF2182 domain-containing protein [Gaiellales bacterium]|nr:DUF2182 domain-containing protein [Gaiellales bacterium]
MAIVRGHRPLAAAILALAAGSWVSVLAWGAGTRSSPGTMGMGTAGFLGMWSAMMAAMMLPGVTPVAALYGACAGLRRAAGLVSGYLLAWSTVGLAALASVLGAERLASSDADAATWTGAAVLVAAGAYQWSPLKARCRTECRSPAFIGVRAASHRGPLRSVRAGLHYSLACIGCCWALMAALIVLGVMDPRWMAAFAGVITLEKTWRRGESVSVVTGVVLIGLGLLAPWQPGLVPGLHGGPGSMGGM